MCSRLRLRNIVFALAVLASCVPRSGTNPGFRDVILREFKLHPRMESQDLFKLVYHAAMGSEHLHVDFGMAREWLRVESESLGDSAPLERQYEVISPDGSIVRVNLRPYLERGLNLDSLAFAFVQTASLVHRDTARLVAYWRDVQALAAEKRIPMSTDTLTAILESARANSFPAPGHSPAYRAEYRPAYRVVHRSLLPRLGITQ